MAKYHIVPSLSMIIAKPRSMRIDHAPVPAKELIVVDMARLEDAALKMFPHPVSTVAKEYEEFQTAINNGEKVVKNRKLRELYLKIDHATKRWPPKFGTIEFGEYLYSFDGMRHLFWLVVGRHGRMKRVESDRLSKRLTVGQWKTLGKIAWGRTVEISISRDTRSDQEMNDGMDWAYEFYELETKRGWTRDYILQMPISHFLSSISKPCDFIVDMDDYVPRSPSVQFH